MTELNCIQQTIAYSFYRLGETCKDYRNIEELSDEVFLPAVLQEIEEEIVRHLKKEWFLIRRIIDPLVGFGLLECKYIQEEHFNRMDQVRKTPLFDKFISLNL